LTQKPFSVFQIQLMLPQYKRSVETEQEKHGKSPLLALC